MHVRATPSIGRGRAIIAGAQTDAPQFVMGARFGEAALAGMHKGQAHILVLGGFCQVVLRCGEVIGKPENVTIGSV